jgi:hypothetical protein
VRGWQLLNAGFNASARTDCSSVPGSTDCKPDAAQVRPLGGAPLARRSAARTLVSPRLVSSYCICSCLIAFSGASERRHPPSPL